MCKINDIYEVNSLEEASNMGKTIFKHRLEDMIKNVSESEYFVGGICCGISNSNNLGTILFGDKTAITACLMYLFEKLSSAMGKAEAEECFKVAMSELTEKK